MEIRQYLEPIAEIFRNLGVPEPIVHWGHPLMMGIVIFAMGTFVGFTGWRRRVVTDEAIALESGSNHRKMAPFMFLFMALGYTGGVLSLVMQEQEIFESPHFWTGSVVLALLAANGFISLTKFGGNQAALRTTHAYLGSIALFTMLIHTVLGLTLGFAI
ncbi:MAG: DUF4079 domain-containing protein [Okeania sp. SIO3I5]|uniref:DUF4079 domain-containing protein n=1 Tax=Okeania sp. SIO3I5 TaxID=2607805 RepID=UPI0013BDB4F5|nr:DUF4079 domain-containing protein [Okeania sp. SIO3I5]NEQ35424.1 DUF4079 domain-containing protein [Okeania sp. SIO3I5]